MTRPTIHASSQASTGQPCTESRSSPTPSSMEEPKETDHGTGQVLHEARGHDGRRCSRSALPHGTIPMPVTSAALCLWRHNRGSGAPADDGLEVLLVHPGGPFWASKDEHAWSFPKGEFNPETEDALDAAKLEFAEELGVVPPEGDYVDLDEVIQKGGKVVRAWGDRRRRRYVEHHKQHFRSRMAASLGKTPEISRGGPSRMVLTRTRRAPPQSCPGRLRRSNLRHSLRACG